MQWRVYERGARVVSRGVEVAQPGALLTVVCSCVAWLSFCGPGVESVCSVVDVHCFGFRVCRSVWLAVRGAA